MNGYGLQYQNMYSNEVSTFSPSRSQLMEHPSLVLTWILAPMLNVQHPSAQC
jgi:hypothetical protein